MKVSEQEIVRRLLTVDEEFKSLHQAHQAMKDKLAEFERKSYLTTKEQMEIKRIKKEKLMGKDKMYAKINEYKRNNVVEM
jgi:uncharacterized protein YdcH (DUF465 family)